MKPSIQKIDVSRETLLKTRRLYETNQESLDKYIDQLLWWNSKINLVSRDVSRETIRDHIVHSLLPSSISLLQGVDFWIDAGTGGGLPGIPLAISEPRINWLLNDVVKKKIMAVKQMTYHLELENASSEAESVGNIKIDEGAGIITKHAFSVSALTSMTKGKAWKKIIMYKGASEAEDEVASAGLSGKSTIYRFQFGVEDPFYEGKALLLIEP